MDETKIKGERPPRYRLFERGPKHQPTGAALCASDNFDELRKFPRRPDKRYVLFDRRDSIPVSNLDVNSLTDFRSTSDKSDGAGWYCQNSKCGKLIVPAAALPTGETLVRIMCPHCDYPGHYLLQDFGWKRWEAR
jgi:hypothetical protein